jgi:hypothetical protein
VLFQQRRIDGATARAVTLVGEQASPSSSGKVQNTNATIPFELLPSFTFCCETLCQNSAL